MFCIILHLLIRLWAQHYVSGRTARVAVATTTAALIYAEKVSYISISAQQQLARP